MFATIETLLRFGESLVGKFDVRLRGIDELSGSFDIENGVVHILVDLLNLIGEASF